jgi:hypothetical protein
MKFNGHIVLNADGTAQIKNAFIEQLAHGSVPAASGSNVGRMIYVTSTGSGYTANTFYYSDGATWQSVATGAGAGGVQTEVDALETSIGAAVTSSGTFNAAAFTGANIVSATSITDAINQLDGAISGKDTLDEILPGSAGQVIYNNGGTWATAAPGATSGVQAYDAGLTSIAGLSTSADQMLYTTGADTYTVTGLTAFGRSLIDDADSAAARTTLGVVIGTDVQAFDPDLSSLAALTPTDDNIIVSTASGYELQTPAQVRTTLSLVPGTDVQAYDADLAQIAGFTPADGGFLVGTGGAEGSRWAVETGATARTSLGLGDIATHDASEFIRADGTSTVTADISLNNHKLVAVAPGTAGTDAINKNQLDAATMGLSWKQAVRAATTATITLSSAPASIDGVALTAGDRVLVKNQSAPADNGIYVFAAAASPLTRATDMDAAAEFAGATVFVTEGTANADSGWTQTAEVATVGTDAVTFAQFTGSGTYTAGTGLSLTGNTFNVNLGAGIVELPSDEVGLDLYDALTGAIILTTDGSARSTSSASKLHLKTNTSQFDQDATNGLFLKASGVTATELAASVAGAGLSGGAGTALAVNVDDASIEINADTLRVKAGGVTNAMLSTGGVITLKSNSGAQTEGMVLGEDLNFEATSGTGLSVAVSAGNTVTVAGVDATTTTKGVASFTAADFSVTSGVVSAVAKSIDSLTDVAVSGATAGDTLVHNGTNFVNRKVYFLYDGASATTHTVTHNLGQKYANVTVVETATDEVVIPQSITFDSANALTVTFNSAMACKVVVMAVA